MGASEAAAVGRRRHWVHPTPGRKEDSIGQTKEGEGQRGRHPIASANSSKTFTGTAGTTYTRQRGTESTTGNDRDV